MREAKAPENAKRGPWKIDLLAGGNGEADRRLYGDKVWHLVAKGTNLPIPLKGIKRTKPDAESEGAT